MVRIDKETGNVIITIERDKTDKLWDPYEELQLRREALYQMIEGYYPETDTNPFFGVTQLLRDMDYQP